MRSGLAALFLLIGFGFFMAAVWMLMAQTWNSLIATAAMGGIFVALGLAMRFMAGRVTVREEKALAATAAPEVAAAAAIPVALSAAFTAFTAGAQAGHKARGRD